MRQYTLVAQDEIIYHASNIDPIMTEIKPKYIYISDKLEAKCTTIELHFCISSSSQVRENWLDILSKYLLSYHKQYGIHHLKKQTKILCMLILGHT